MRLRANIVLIGMPGSGKSTIGRRLAQQTGREFIDGDAVIEAKEGKKLPAIIAETGLEGFCDIEARHLGALALENHVIATGGSVVYRDGAMKHLRDIGVVVFLDVPFAELERRLGNLAARGVVIAPGKTLRQLYDERDPLYRKYAEVTVNCAGRGDGAVVEEIIAGVQ
ncbi:MAG: shikimate kinase [Planctomycetota bacterium]